MNILYKYCDQLGIVKILESLELKLPYISEVNDPLECLPFFYCPDDKSAIEARYLLALKRKKMKYHLVTLGCQMNMSDSERVSSVFEAAGFEPTDSEEDANIIGILACSQTLRSGFPYGRSS